MPRDYKLYLQDILGACGKVQEYVSGHGSNLQSRLQNI